MTEEEKKERYRKSGEACKKFYEKLTPEQRKAYADSHLNSLRKSWDTLRKKTENWYAKKVSVYNLNTDEERIMTIREIVDEGIAKFTVVRLCLRGKYCKAGNIVTKTWRITDID